MDKIRILVIDDEILIRTALQGILTSQGFEVRVCETGLKALTLLAKEFFDVVLLDLKLPIMTALNCLKK